MREVPVPHDIIEHGVMTDFNKAHYDYLMLLSLESQHNEGGTLPSGVQV